MSIMKIFIRMRSNGFPTSLTDDTSERVLVGLAHKKNTIRRRTWFSRFPYSRPTDWVTEEVTSLSRLYEPE